MSFFLFHSLFSNFHQINTNNCPIDIFAIAHIEIEKQYQWHK
jgi:hypothetical protein